MIRCLLLVCLLIHSTEAGRGLEKKPLLPVPDKKWMTIGGAEPVVAAHGGYSGVFPASSELAFGVASILSLPHSLMYCEMQFTSDGVGFCMSQINLENYTTIADVYPGQQKTYVMNGKKVKGWFAFDYTYDALIQNVTLVQNVASRPAIMDGVLPIQDPLTLSEADPPFIMWVNVENDLFYNQHKVHPAATVNEMLQSKNPPKYISSTETGFLKEMGKGKKKIQKAKTKLLFKFKEMDDVEQTSNETYGSLLNKLSDIKLFASGILVPKNYIWPVNKQLYLMPATSLVPDAHKEGLEVYAYGFGNDFAFSYNYSYDPTKEYLQFIDNSEFSVDGVVSDFPSTASESIACLAQNRNATRKLKNLIISHNGASGDYPGSTDLAYLKAIDDGADVIDCNVQLSQDGVAFCMDSIDLVASTNAALLFPDRASQVPEIGDHNGIFSFDLTSHEIKSLKPLLRSPFDKGSRNPVNKDKGKILTLSDFLEIAKNSTSVGILINIEYAAYLATKGLDIIKAVKTTMSDAGHEKQSTQKVMIQSDDSLVLEEFKQIPTYEKVYNIVKEWSGVSAKVPSEIKKFADAVSVRRDSVILYYRDPIFMSKNFSNLIPAMHDANLSVYVGTLKNEFSSFLFDFFADPYEELATLIQAKVDGVVSEFPATAAAYMRSPCAELNQHLPYTILPVKPGDMYNEMRSSDGNTKVAPSPEPIFNPQDVVDPPLPPVAANTPKTDSSSLQPNPKVPTPASAPAASLSTTNAAPHSLTTNNVALVFISTTLAILYLLNVQSKFP